MSSSSGRSCLDEEDSTGKECTTTAVEYESLLVQAESSLSCEEAVDELLVCARYGELDPVRAILDIYPSVINERDRNSDCTALHLACANNHESIVSLLLLKGANCLVKNKSGNTPLHWAASNGHPSIVSLLLQQKKEEIDVLDKNDFGRTILTEGFQSGNDDVIAMLLEHSSADEDRLLTMQHLHSQGGQQPSPPPSQEIMSATDGNLDDEDSSSLGALMHEFNFLATNKYNHALWIRELPIQNADNPFQNNTDTTGSAIWCSSLVMARWMASLKFDNNETVLELGAGCGVPGLAVARYTQAKQVVVTDFHVNTVTNLQFNIDLNIAKMEKNKPKTTKSNIDKTNEQQQLLSRRTTMERVKALSMDWTDESTWPKDEKVDCIIGSDLIYQKSIVPLLLHVISSLLNENGTFYYVCPSDGRDGVSDFVSTMTNAGLTCKREIAAPESYKANPLMSKDEDDFFLHFHELTTTEYTLYEFQRSFSSHPI